MTAILTAPDRPASADAAPKAVLSVRSLSIDAVSDHGRTRLVDNVSFDVFEGEVLGIVGESGSGKSLSVLAVLGLLAHGLEIASGSIVLNGRELVGLPFAEMQKIRGNTASIIFQDPLTTLNPVLRIGKQIGEAVRLHNPQMTTAQVKARVLELLSLVGIPNPAKRYVQYPNEFSGGMRQRVVIAIAMANEPDLLIADEPTTALDVTIQAQIMKVLAEVRRRSGASMILITHDLGLVAENADRIAVMYSGRIVEEARPAQVFDDPNHPYTGGLIASLPEIDRRVASLYSIPGVVPDPRKRPPGCAFNTRCAIGGDRELCRTVDPVLETFEAGRKAACHYRDEARAWFANRQAGVQVDGDANETGNGDNPVLLKVADVTKTYKLRGGWWSHQTLQALKNVSFEIRRGRTLGIVGESGCGKSTLAKVILRLLDATGGDVYLNGRPFFAAAGKALRHDRRTMQVVFQDPYSSLDPRMTIHEVIAEPLRINGGYSHARIDELLGHVGLSPQMAGRRPPEFSGGQRQRIAIARALALNPDVLVLDEAVSALDVSIQAQIINLLMRLQRDLGLTYVFISHDLSVVRHISDDVAVMYLGRIIEHGKVEDVFDRPAHPYTKALLDAVPKPRAGAPEQRFYAVGDLPDPMHPPSGCAFRTRCPIAQQDCAAIEPPLAPVDARDLRAACIHPLPDPLVRISA